MVDMMWYVTFGLAGVLMLRKPVRRAFGAGPAFTLWLLPVLLAALPWLPGLPPALRVVTVPGLLPSLVPVVGTALPDQSSWVALIWLIGSAAMMLRLATRYWRLRRQCRTPPVDVLRRLQATLPDLDSRRVRLHATGPGLLWAMRSLLLLPPDFTRRFACDQQALVLRHELTHLRRGDPLWRLLAEIGLALLWFHPLAWLAAPRLRLDQELACDEAVLRATPQAQARYARTLLDTAGIAAAPVFTPWLAEPQLKERLVMIGQYRPGATRRRMGFLAVAVLLAASAWVAQSPLSTVAEPHAAANLEYNAHLAPKYPADAVKNHDQGMVILEVLVGTDGQPQRITVHSADNVAPSLVKAASDAAMKWRFNPALRDGKPIESYARVPVRFSLTDTDDSSAAPGAAPTTGKPANVRQADAV